MIKLDVRKNVIIYVIGALFLIFSSVAAFVVDFKTLDDCIISKAEAEEMIVPIEIRSLNAEIRQLDREVFAIDLLEGDNVANSRDKAMKNKLLRELDDLKKDRQALKDSLKD